MTDALESLSKAEVLINRLTGQLILVDQTLMESAADIGNLIGDAINALEGTE